MKQTQIFVPIHTLAKNKIVMKRTQFKTCGLSPQVTVRRAVGGPDGHRTNWVRFLKITTFDSAQGDVPTTSTVDEIGKATQ